MSEFFLELFSEEIPSNLQKNLRENLLKSFNEFFLEKFKEFINFETIYNPWENIDNAPVYSRFWR